MNAFKSAFRNDSRLYLSLVALAFALKLILQITSAFPAIAQMAYEHRTIVIAYLHLVLIGVISFLLFAWYSERNLFETFTDLVIRCFGVCFVLMELILTTSPWWTNAWSHFFTPSWLLFLFSLILSICCLCFLVTYSRKHDKNQERR